MVAIAGIADKQRRRLVGEGALRLNIGSNRVGQTIDRGVCVMRSGLGDG